MSNWFTRLFTVSKHTDPAVAAAAQPTLDAAHAAVTEATASINPALDELASGAESLLDAYLSKIGVAGALLTPAAHVAVSIGAATLKGIVDSKLGLQPGDTVPAPAAG